MEDTLVKFVDIEAVLKQHGVVAFHTLGNEQDDEVRQKLYAEFLTLSELPDDITICAYANTAIGSMALRFLEEVFLTSSDRDVYVLDTFAKQRIVDFRDAWRRAVEKGRRLEPLTKIVCDREILAQKQTMDAARVAFGVLYRRTETGMLVRI